MNIPYDNYIININKLSDLSFWRVIDKHGMVWLVLGESIFLNYSSQHIN